MSEDRTKETKDARSFEERVFARFDSINDRFDRLETIIDRIEEGVTQLRCQRELDEQHWKLLLKRITDSKEHWKYQLGVLEEKL